MLVQGRTPRLPRDTLRTGGDKNRISISVFPVVKDFKNLDHRAHRGTQGCTRKIVGVYLLEN